MTFKELKEEYKKVFFLADDGVLDVAMATILSTYMRGDPIWTMVVGPSSGGKSEIINTFMNLDFTFHISDMTENTLLSASNMEKASLLDTIGNIGCILMKDFTSILSMRAEKKGMIIAQFREMYDGKLDKKTGSGKNPSWEGKMTFLAGVTDAIYTEDQNSGVMGQRAIHYVLPDQDRIVTTKQARENRKKGNIIELRQRLQDMTKEYVEQKITELPENIPDIDPDLSDEIIYLAEAATAARTGINRDYRGQIQMVTSKEMPMRVSEQIHMIAGMLKLMNDGEELSDDQKDIIYKICIDCIPKNRRETIMKLIEYHSTTTVALAKEKGWNTETARICLEDLNVLGMVDRQSGMNNENLWKLRDNYKTLFNKYLHIKIKEEQLESDDDDDLIGDPYSTNF